ncbi:MAG: hypothetical protein C0399_04370 [Syntrophus sp. (in: bacteria)]|nr:hypothetical protein [Syntrophus sp. (in: bacteria)]
MEAVRDLLQYMMKVSNKAFHRRSGDHISSLCDGCVNTIQRCIHYAQRIKNRSSESILPMRGFSRVIALSRLVFEQGWSRGIEIAFYNNAAK